MAMKGTKATGLTAALLETAGDMRRSGVLDANTHEKIIRRHLGEGGSQPDSITDEEVGTVSAASVARQLGLRRDAQAAMEELGISPVEAHPLQPVRVAEIMPSSAVISDQPTMPKPPPIEYPRPHMQQSEMITLKPNFMGMGIDLKELGRRVWALIKW